MSIFTDILGKKWIAKTIKRLVRHGATILVGVVGGVTIPVLGPLGAAIIANTDTIAQLIISAVLGSGALYFSGKNEKQKK